MCTDALEIQSQKAVAANHSHSTAARNYWKEYKRHAGRHAHRAFGGEFPIEAKIALAARLCVGGDERNEKDAFLDLFADLRVPLIACSNPPSASNHTSMPERRKISQMRRAASASCDAEERKTAPRGAERSTFNAEFSTLKDRPSEWLDVVSSLER